MLDAEEMRDISSRPLAGNLPRPCRTFLGPTPTFHKVALQLVNLLISFTSSTEPLWHGLLYCLLLLLASVTNTILYQHLCYMQVLPPP